MLAHTVEYLDHVSHAFYRPEVRKVHKDALARVGVLSAALRIVLAVILVAVDEVVDHLDVVARLEVTDRAIAQVVGNRGNAIAVLNGKFRDRQVRSVQTNQRNVSAVQRGHKGKTTAVVPVGQHLLGEQCADRVRNGVVDVQQVEAVNISNFGHTRSQGKVIGRIVEERVIGN